MSISDIKFENPAFVRTWFIPLGASAITEIKRKRDEIFKMPSGLEGKWRFQDEMDYCIAQFWIMNPGRKSGFAISDLQDAFSDVGKLPVGNNDESVSMREYLIADRDISVDIVYPDRLLYDIHLKKVDNVFILYSPVADNEFLVNFTKHLFFFHLYYGKIIRFYEKFKNEVYAEVRKTHSELIRTCSAVMDPKRGNFQDSDLQTLSSWSLAMDEMNFALQYDMESIESNLSNMKSRIRSIGAEESRYFQNHVEKAEFVLNTFDKVQDKNELIKETILKNGIAFVASRIEAKKLSNESERIYHLKNIKEIVSGLALIEIFINGLSESVKIFKLEGILAQGLASTALMRMVFLTGFLLTYAAYVTYVAYSKYRIRKAKMEPS
jgi:hypothetical protein